MLQFYWNVAGLYALIKNKRVLVLRVSHKSCWAFCQDCSRKLWWGSKKKKEEKRCFGAGLHSRHRSKHPPTRSLWVSHFLQAKPPSPEALVSTQSSQVRLMTFERGSLICFVMVACSNQSHCGGLEFYPVPKVELVCNKPGLPLPCQHKPSSLQRTTLVLPWRQEVQRI